MPSIRSKICRILAKRLIGSHFNPSLTIDEIRKGMEKATRMAFLPANTNVEKTRYGDIDAELVTGKDANEEYVVLYLHGGGYNTGSPQTHREFTAHISNASHAKVLVPDYRLAPESPFPAALEDAIASYHWLLDNGYSSEKIAIAGESAGGGLTLATCLTLRDNGDHLPSSLTVLSPWTDLEMTGESAKTLEDLDPMLNFEAIRMMALNYIGTSDASSPLISPIHADFKNFPPMLIHVGSDEMLLDDSRRVADSVRQAGVDITIKIYKEMWHFFHVFYRLMPEAKAAVREIGSFIQKNYR
jgi:epsilon-lactone hydrolase